MRVGIIFMFACWAVSIFSVSAFSSTPDCTGVSRWPASMAFVHLKNAGITNNELIDFSKTKVTRLASEKIGVDLYRQIHLITFVEKTGETLQVITSNDASLEECSMGDVHIYIVKQQLP